MELVENDNSVIHVQQKRQLVSCFQSGTKKRSNVYGGLLLKANGFWRLTSNWRWSDLKWVNDTKLQVSYIGIFLSCCGPWHCALHCAILHCFPAKKLMMLFIVKIPKIRSLLLPLHHNHILLKTLRYIPAPWHRSYPPEHHSMWTQYQRTCDLHGQTFLLAAAWLELNMAQYGWDNKVPAQQRCEH